MSASDELQRDPLLPFVEPEADTEVDLVPSHVRVFTPPPEADLSVAVMQALKTLTAGYEAPVTPSRSDPSAPQ